MHKEYIEITQENKKVAKRWEKIYSDFFHMYSELYSTLQQYSGLKNPSRYDFVGLLLLPSVELC